MIRRRRDLLKLVVVVPAAVVGSKLASNKPSYVSAKSEPVLVHCEEIMPYSWGKIRHSHKPVTITRIRRAVSWSTLNTGYLPKVGATLQIEQTFSDKVERFRVKVISHEDLGQELETTGICPEPSVVKTIHMGDKLIWSDTNDQS